MNPQWTTHFLLNAKAAAAVAACLIPLALATAALSWFLQLCYGRGMILRSYYGWLTYWFWFKPRKRVVRMGDRAYQAALQLHESMNAPPPARSWVIRGQRWWSWFFKPGGGCAYCQSIWVATAFYLLLFGPLGWAAVLWWPLYCGMVYGFVCLLEKKLSPKS